jgi:hypothetical protein
VLGGASIFASALPASASSHPVGLGTAESFAVLAGAGITNTGPTTITGDVGSFETTDQSGFGSVTLTGDSTNHFGDAVTQGAKDDLTTAYNDAAGRTPSTPHAVELGGDRLLPGVYSSGTFGLTGTLTLDAQGNPDALFIFQTGSTLITAPDSEVLVVNGANPCNVFWKVGSSATFDTGTKFVGNVLAAESISALTGATFRGRLLARIGAVTMDTNVINNDVCQPSASETGTGGGDTTTGGTDTTTTSTTTAATTDGTTAGTSGTADGTTAGSTGDGTGATSGGGATLVGLPGTTGGSATTGGRTTGGSGTTGGGTVRVPLAATGADDALLLAGFALVAFGTITLLVARPNRRRFAHSR